MTPPKIFPLNLPYCEYGDPVVIGVLIKDFFPPGPVDVNWSKSGNITNFPPSLPEGGVLYIMTSRLSLEADKCPKDESVTCTVEHATNAPQSVDVPCIGPPPCKPKCCHHEPSLSLQRPSLEDLLLGSNASLTCTLSGLRSNEAASFTWDPTGEETPTQKPAEYDHHGCFRASSVLPVCAESWNSGQTFTCTATHPDFEGVLTATITKPPGIRPQVHLLPPPSEELALNELVSLTCLVRGFSPKDVLVRWLHGNEELPRDSYLVWDPLEEPEAGTTTYAVTSVLRVTAADWKQGHNFSCIVGHESPPVPWTQKTIDHNSGKPTHVNVSVIMSEADSTCY
ncbi:Ig alpha chain C region [Fukomys damarensis]|uniref:Ig alpha chain C region n=1 Tax=Fukomys damarensis TaxID=885580 RepID=A0A091EIJ7_FUKDA|nr:Ig alpha chain C region [Fukomys damarensis]